MEGTKERPGCALVAVIFVLTLVGLYVVGTFQEIEADSKQNYLERVPMLQWAAFINETRLRRPDLALEEILKMPVPFAIPPRVTSRVLTPEERVEDSDCHFVVECPVPRPFTVLSNGSTFYGVMEKKKPKGPWKDITVDAIDLTEPSSSKTNKR
ncbi:hypothetical protein [Roseimicrobium sp. ORNL1]|uniref:hypothetical protein n=1 Tax=Roseimicrobium sp. ORNL1 TaxID=2711231 RepID=UPI0013E1AC3B|nr:hypothetical protein [Roseimicrobium sp. ORNL1]QIF02037.1 hypothetical protein G5S37_11000 [Roseimicrobium sp. ORNL1]